MEDARAAAALLREHAYVRIVARADGDAVCAVALLGHALRRDGIDFHATWAAQLSSDVTAALAEEKNDLTLVVGLGGDPAQSLGDGKRIAIDRASQEIEATVSLTSESSLGSIAQMVGVALNARNLDLAPLALAGTISAHRHLPAPAGLDADVRRDAVAAGIVAHETRLALRGGSVLAALSQADEPTLPGLTGRARAAKKMLTDLRLPADAPMNAFSSGDAERLGSALALKLLQADAPEVALDALFAPRLTALKGPLAGLAAGDLAFLAEAAAARGRCGLAFAALWPDEQAANECAELAATFRDEIVAALLKPITQEGALAIVDAPDAGMCAPLADRVALTIPRGRIAMARAAPAGTDITIALRAFANEHHIADATKRAAAACAGTARGTRNAARALVPAAEETRFRKLLNEGLA